MGKISQVSAKYIVRATIHIDGVVEKPDVIGAIFGQTEGLLGSELELRELQRSGRIGRIEVNVEIKNGKTLGNIVVPSSLDKAETSIVAAALEIIERIGPCNAKIRVNKMEDVRVSKRNYVVERAKSLLKNLMDSSMPDSAELADEVTFAVRVMEIEEYGRDRLPAGPGVDEGDELTIVEGRADVLNLLKHGIKNCIGMNGTSVPETVIELSKRKITTAFVDGDRGGDLIIKSLLQVANIDYVTRAPDGKEVEELAKKEIHQSLRSKVVPQQIKLDRPAKNSFRPRRLDQRKPSYSRDNQSRHSAKTQISPQQRETFKNLSEELIGTRAAYLLDNDLKILGKVPVSELKTTLEGLKEVNAVVFDGTANKDFSRTAEESGVKIAIAMDSELKSGESQVEIVTMSQL